MAGPRPPAAILDVDGTLVDTTYHHALAWSRAFRRHGHVVPLWRIHRSIGMGADQLIPALLGDGVDPVADGRLRETEKASYAELIDETVPFEGARELIEELKARGHEVVLSSSAKPEELEHYLALLEARDTVDGWTSAGDVERTKPEPDLVHAALAKVADHRGVLVGDSTWDCEAARRAGVPSIGLLTGGFSKEELRAAGATRIYASLVDLRDDVERTPLGQPAG
jgi:HAD superfamily hydrolase (TIGR01509 family)